MADSLTVVLFDALDSSPSSWVPAVEQQLQSWLHLHTITVTVPLTPSELRSSKQRSCRSAALLVETLQSQQQQGTDVQQLVLVAQGFGGHLLKEACIQLQHCTTNPQLPACTREQYTATLHSIRAVVFYSTPHQPVPRLALPEYEYVLPDLAPVCRKFTVMCSAHGWKTLGVGAAVQLDPCQSVPLKAAAKGMTSFVAVPADQHGVCRPTCSSHPSCVALQRFLQQLLQDGAAAGGDVPCSLLPVKLRMLQRLMTV